MLAGLIAGAIMEGPVYMQKAIGLPLGDTDRKGQPISKAGSSLLRTTLVRAADNARRTDPQLARAHKKRGALAVRSPWRSP